MVVKLKKYFGKTRHIKKEISIFSMNIIHTEL